MYDITYDVTSLSFDTSAGKVFKMAAPLTVLLFESLTILEGQMPANPST